MQPINRIVTHVSPHLDEIFAIWLLRRYGEEQFPGVAEAPIVYWTAGMESRTWGDYWNSGTLLIGVGGGPFDEHPGDGEARKKNKTATSLVAEYLGLAEVEAFMQLMQYVVKNDLQGSKNAFELGRMVTMLHNEHPDDPQRVIDWTTTVIDGHLKSRLRLFSETIEEYAKVEFIQLRNRGRRCKLAVITSDNDQIPSFALSKRGGLAEVVIVAKSSGNVVIMSRPDSKVILKDVAKVLRIEEHLASGSSEPLPRWDVLAEEGTLPLVPEWHYFKAGESLFNGSKTHPDVPPTRLGLDRIVELVKLALNTSTFETLRSDTCNNGVCASTQSDRCPWYDYGLSRCRSIRYHMPRTEVHIRTE